MADEKTHLREIAVSTIIGLFINNVPFNLEDLYDTKKLYTFALKCHSNDISLAYNITNLHSSNETKKIINNAYNLAKKIFTSQEFSFSKQDIILWTGYNTQKSEPYDIKIGKYNFSLKEDSYILKNMGLYQLINILTNSNYAKGLHVFEFFSPKEYNAWFLETWKHLLSFLNTNKRWILKSNKYHSEIVVYGDSVMFIFNDIASIVPTNISNFSDFMSYTKSITREKVFSKWINNELSDKESYNLLKKECANKAGIILSNYINNNFSKERILDFFQLYDTEYYYCKTTHEETTILKVPQKKDFFNEVEFLGCSYSVPNSQLNIINSFQNKKTKKILEFRNECRFSHGQFNGTPEAKMYISKTTTLADLYTPVLK